MEDIQVIVSQHSPPSSLNLHDRNDTKVSSRQNSPAYLRKRDDSLRLSCEKNDKNEKDISPSPSPSSSPRPFKSKSESNYSLRNSNSLVRPRVNSTRYGRNSVSYIGAQLWDALPHSAKSANSVVGFKMRGASSKDGSKSRQTPEKKGWAKIKRELITKQKDSSNNNNNNNNITTDITSTTNVPTTAKTNNNNANNTNTMSPPKSPSCNRKSLELVNNVNMSYTSSVNNIEKKKMRLLILGEDGVGKSAFIVRYLTRRFIGEYDPLLEGVFRKCINLNNQDITVEMKDTAKGINWQKRTSDIIWADAFIVIYSITDKNSFNEIQKVAKYIEQQKRSRGIPCLIIGNKKDMSHERKVSFVEGSKLASTIHGTFCELSVSDNYTDLEGVVNHFVKENCIGFKQGNQLVSQLKILTSKSSPEIRQKNREDRLCPQQIDFPKIVIEADEAKTERKGRALWQKLLTNNNDFKKTKK